MTVLCPGRLVRKTRVIFVTVEGGVINFDPISRGIVNFRGFGNVL